MFDRFGIYSTCPLNLETLFFALLCADKRPDYITGIMKALIEGKNEHYHAIPEFTKTRCWQCNPMLPANSTSLPQLRAGCSPPTRLEQPRSDCPHRGWYGIVIFLSHFLDWLPESREIQFW